MENAKKQYDYANNKATLPKEDVNNAKWPDKKEMIDAFSVVALRNGELSEPITAKLFMGRSNSASTVYACIWVHDKKRGHWYSGAGNAGGYGYCKRSAALAEAIRSADIKLEASISGVGERAMTEALAAIARALGFRKFHIVHH